MNVFATFLLVSLPLVAKTGESPYAQLYKFIERFMSRNTDDIGKKVPLPDDTFLEVPAYLSKYGYPFETHPVTTEDGYTIELHRIPQNRVNSHVVLLLPPLFTCVIDYINRGPNISLALLLYDQGYDVWLMNPRGSRYSMNHKSLHSYQKQFWDFSFHERGFYDAASSIDYALETTGVSKLVLIGYSEGTSEAMALLTTRPEYNDKVELVVLLSPIAYMGGVQSPLILIVVEYQKEIMLIADLIHLYGLPYTEWISRLAVSICSAESFIEVCADLLGFIMGPDSEQLDRNYMLVFISDKPAGVSVKELVHYGQNIAGASFNQFDYGAESNLKRYGTIEAPAYNLSKLTAPVAIFHGKNDYFSDLKDVKRLVPKLPNLVHAHLIEYEKFNHMDFIGAKDVRTILYYRVLDVIEQYTTRR